MEKRTARTIQPLHARPLDRLVRTARDFASRISLCYGSRTADGKNVMELLLLGVPKEAEVIISADGPDEREALDALVSLIEQEAPKQQGPIQGRSGAPFLGIGRLHREARIPKTRPALSSEEELHRLDQALITADAALAALNHPDDPFCDIFVAQRTMLSDPGLLEELQKRIKTGCSTEQAVLDEFNALAHKFSTLPSNFAKERFADLADVRDWILRGLGSLVQKSAESHSSSKNSIILLVHEATPSLLSLLDLHLYAGVISENGGPTSHAAIVARSRGIPLVFAAKQMMDSFAEGDWLLVDGRRGIIERSSPNASLPLPREPAICEDKDAAPRTSQGGHVQHKGGTADGAPVFYRANIGAPGDLEVAREQSASGCGLLRTELLFGGWQRSPTIHEQHSALLRIARTFSPHPIVVRLYDVAADKQLAFLVEKEAKYKSTSGIRGIRFLFERPQVLGEQLEAIHLTRKAGYDVRALIPMVIDTSDIVAVKKLTSPDLPLGAMIETPAAAVHIEFILDTCDFVSIGTNDLTQLTLGQDRATLSTEDILHPAVLRLIKSIVQASSERHKEVSVCGELSSMPVAASVLIGLGVTILSLAPAQITTIRQAIRKQTLEELKSLAEKALQESSGRKLHQLLQTIPFLNESSDNND